MREPGWLQGVFAAASERVEQWPEWKKQIETRDSDLQTGAAEDQATVVNPNGQDSERRPEQ